MTAKRWEGGGGLPSFNGKRQAGGEGRACEGMSPTAQGKGEHGESAIRMDWAVAAQRGGTGTGRSLSSKQDIQDVALGCRKIEWRTQSTPALPCLCSADMLGELGDEPSHPFARNRPPCAPPLALSGTAAQLLFGVAAHACALARRRPAGTRHRPSAAGLTDASGVARRLWNAAAFADAIMGGTASRTRLQCHGHARDKTAHAGPRGGLGGRWQTSRRQVGTTISSYWAGRGWLQKACAMCSASERGSDSPIAA